MNISLIKNYFSQNVFNTYLRYMCVYITLSMSVNPFPLTSTLQQLTLKTLMWQISISESTHYKFRLKLIKLWLIYRFVTMFSKASSCRGIKLSDIIFNPTHTTSVQQTTLKTSRPKVLTIFINECIIIG